MNTCCVLHLIGYCLVDIGPWRGLLLLDYGIAANIGSII